jgi:hypothetical protein
MRIFLIDDDDDDDDDVWNGRSHAMDDRIKRLKRWAINPITVPIIVFAILVGALLSLAMVAADIFGNAAALTEFFTKYRSVTIGVVAALGTTVVTLPFAYYIVRNIERNRGNRFRNLYLEEKVNHTETAKEIAEVTASVTNVKEEFETMCQLLQEKQLEMEAKGHEVTAVRNHLREVVKEIFIPRAYMAYIDTIRNGETKEACIKITLRLDGYSRYFDKELKVSLVRLQASIDYVQDGGHSKKTHRLKEFEKVMPNHSPAELPILIPIAPTELVYILAENVGYPSVNIDSLYLVINGVEFKYQSTQTLVIRPPPNLY